MAFTPIDEKEIIDEPVAEWAKPRFIPIEDDEFFGIGGEEEPEPVQAPEVSEPAEAPKSRFTPISDEEFFGIEAPTDPIPVTGEEGFLRQAADVPLKIGESINTSLRALTDLFGADNSVSQNLTQNADWYRSLLSAQALEDEQEVGRILKAAEDKGIADQLAAGLEAFSVAPVDFVASGIGSLAVFVATGLVGRAAAVAGAARAGLTGARAATAVQRGVQATQLATGAGMGAGIVKGEIYQSVKDEMLAQGKTEEEARQIAMEAQSYGGKNLDQILIGAGLGTIDAFTGAEKIIGKVLTKGGLAPNASRIGSILKNGIAEGAPEFIQAAQEKFASNLALQREGVDVSLTSGVFSQGALEGLVGVGMGAGAGAIEPRTQPATKEEALAAASETQDVARQNKDVAPATASLVEGQAESVIQENAETPEQRVARLQEEATAAAGIELEEEPVVGVEPTVPVTPPVEPAPEGAVAPVEPSTTGLTEGFATLGEGAVDNYYSAILQSIQEKGEVPSPERKSNVGQAWDRVKGQMEPEEFVRQLRINAEDPSKITVEPVVEPAAVEPQPEPEVAPIAPVIAPIPQIAPAEVEPQVAAQKAIDASRLSGRRLGIGRASESVEQAREVAYEAKQEASLSKTPVDKAIQIWEAAGNETKYGEPEFASSDLSFAVSGGYDKATNEVKLTNNPKEFSSLTGDAALTPRSVVRHELGHWALFNAADNDLVSRLFEWSDGADRTEILDPWHGGRAGIAYPKTKFDSRDELVSEAYSIWKSGGTVPEAVIPMLQELDALVPEQLQNKAIQFADSHAAKLGVAPETPNLEPLRRVARAEQTEEDVSGLVGQGLVELYNGQPVIAQAGLEALPEAERPRLNPEARKIQIDTGSNEVVAEAIAKNLRIGVDQVGTGVRMPAGWTLVEDIYVPPTPQEVVPEAPVAPEVAKPTRKPRRVKDTATMTAGEINKELDRLRAESSKITDEFIAAGRGEERPSEYLKKTDPLSVRAKENSNRMQALRNEIRMRYGADISQLPTGKGFGPRARPEPETPPPTTKESVKVAQEILNEQKKKPSEQVGIAAPTPPPMTTTPQAQILPSEQSDKADAVLAISKKNNFYTLWFVRQFIDGKPVPPRAKSFQYLTILSTDPDEAVRKASVYASDIAGGQSLSVAFSGKNLQNLEGAKTVAILPEFVEWDKLSTPLRGAAAGPIGQQTVGFGKYRDIKVDDLYAKDSNYVDWLMSTNPSNKRVRDIVNYLRTSSPELQLMADVRELEGARIRAYEDRESRRKGGEQVPVSTLVRREGQIVEEAVEQVAPKPKAPKLTERKAKDQMVDIVSPRANLPDRIATNLKPQMYPIQVDGANAVIDSMDRFSVALNGDGAGVGKTRQIIAVADHYAKQGKPVVIVTENAAIGKPWEGRKTPILGGSMAKDSEAMGVTLNLLTETDKPADGGSISITTYNRVTTQNIPTGAIVIFDESQNLANTFGAMPDERAGTELGQWQIKFRDIFGRAERTAFYSATPADKPHQLAYLYKVLGFNSPEEYLSNAVENGTVIKTRRFGSIEQKYYDVPSGKNRKANLYKWVNGIMTEAGNNGRFIKREISYEGTDVQFHDVKGTDLEKNPWAKPFLDALAQMSSFQAQGYLLLAPNSYVLYGAELTKIGDAVKIAKRELDAGRKIVIYFSRINDLKIRGRMSTMGMDGRMELSDPVDLGIIPSPVVLLRDELKKEGIKFTELHGKSGTTSQKAQKEFAGPTNVLLASVESGGTGINLDDTTGKEPRTEIFMFSPYRGISTIQAMGRIWRASTIQNDNKPNRFIFATASDIDADASRSAVLAKKLQLMNASLGGTAVSRLPMSKTSYDPSQLVGIELPEEGVESAAMAERTGVLMPVDIKWSPTRKGGFYSKATADLLEWMERGGPDRTGINVSVFKSRDSGEWVALADKEYKPEDFVEKPETPPPTPPTIRESRRPKLQMPRPAGMETEAVATKLESLGFGRGGIVSVVNEPDASFEGRTIIRDGKVVGIELNAAALKDDAAVERVLNHEIAESANADGALNKLVAGLTPKERKEINDAITRLGYAEKARTAEEAARAVELLAEGWRGRKWFDRAVARVEAWANKLGYKLTRRAAEYIAARNVSEINAEFKRAYNKFVDKKTGDEARYSYAGVTANTPQFMRDSLSVAQAMAAKGEDSNSIRLVTGWILNPYDRKLRWEIPDNGVKLATDFDYYQNVLYGDKSVADFVKNKFANKSKSFRDKIEKFYDPKNVMRNERKYLPLVAVINHPQLFKAYPDAQFIEVSFNPSESESGSPRGKFSPFLEKITIRTDVLANAMERGRGDDVSSLLRIILHETQHWIQEKEGFASGASPKSIGMQKYRMAAGEIEARDVAQRAFMGKKARALWEPYSTDNIAPEDAIVMDVRGDQYASEIRESRREDGIPTFSEGSPEASTLSNMKESMAKVDAASEAKGPTTYKISEIASVWMDQGGDTRQLQDLISENTNLTPANAKKVANAIAKQYDIQNSIAETAIETEAGATLEGLPEGMEIPKEVDPKRPKTVLQRVIDATTGVRAKPVKITGDEKALLKGQIRLKARETRESKKAQQETADAVVEAIKALELRGPMRPKQAQALAKRAAKVIWTSEKSMENFIAYAERVMTNTNYDADLREAKAAQKRAKELSKRETVAAPQRETLEAIANIGVNLLEDPLEYANVVNHYLRSFKPVTSESYVVVPDAEMKSYLSGAEDIVSAAKAEFEAENNERLAAKYGISVDELKKYMDSDDIMRALETYAKREVIEGILNEKSAGVKEALKGVDLTTMREDQRKLIKAMMDIDYKSLDSAEKQSYVRIGNNIIFNNNQTNGAEFFVATAQGQQAARDLAKNTDAMTKNKAWANIAPALGSRRAKKVLKSWAEELQSVADTFRNAFGKKAMTVFYEAMGMVDLDLGFTAANKVLEEIQEKMAKFYDKLDKKYKQAARDQDGILSEGIAGYLIQNVPEKEEGDSLAQRRNLIQQDIIERRKSGDEDRMQMADRVEAILQKIDGENVDTILANLKREYPANYESLMWLKDELFPQYKEFLKRFDENFNDQANNYNTPNYLPISYMTVGPSIDLLQSTRRYYDSLSSAPKQSSYTIKRSDYTQLPLGDNRKPKEIGFNLRSNAYNSLSDQITKAYTNPAWQRIDSFLKTPEAEEALGGQANKDFFAERINRLKQSRERRGSINKNTFDKAVDIIATLGRAIGTRIALAGSYQLIRQPSDQVTVAVGVTGRADLMAEHLAPRSIKSARPLIDLFSIGRRGDASSGYKYINQMEGAQSRLERYFTEGRWVQAKEAATRLADKFMLPLKASDFHVAAATWMTLYRAYLAKNKIPFNGWEDAANKIKAGDVSHRRAAGYAENMTDIYQGSSDPTKMATFAQKGKTGSENLLKAILVPFNSFGVQFRSRISSEMTEIMNRSGDWRGKALAIKDLSATIGGTIMFGLAKRFALPALTYGGIKILYAIFGVDVEEPDEEKQKEEFDRKWKQLYGDVISTMIVGGGGQMLESYTIDGMNYIKYMIDSANGSEDVLDDDGEIMSFNKYAKERAPFYRYRSFDNAMSLGILDIGMDQARKSVLNTKMVLTPDEMDKYTPEEQAFLYVALLSDWLYLGGFNDADFARMWDKARRDMINARKEEEKELKRIRSGR